MSQFQELSLSDMDGADKAEWRGEHPCPQHYTACSSGSALHEHLRRWQAGKLEMAQTKVVSGLPWQSGF